MKPIYARNYVLYSGEFSLQAKEFNLDFGEVVPFWLGSNLAEVEESLHFLKAEVYADNYKEISGKAHDFSRGMKASQCFF